MKYIYQNENLIIFEVPLDYIAGKMVVAPCFLKDECLFQCKNDTQEETSTDDDGCSCTDCCCSPFLHCNTCTGCPAPKLFHSPFVTMIQLNDTPLSFYKEKLIPQFSSSIWQPPKIMNL